MTSDIQNQYCNVDILTNEAMPNYVKIGVTDMPISQRMKQLYTTGVPVPFECFYAAKVEKSKNVERRIHRAFDRFRVNSNREFFEIEPEAIAEIIAMVEVENVTPSETYIETPDDSKAIKKLEKRAERFSFEMVDIPIGATLTLDKDEEIICTVVNNREVNFNGNRMSLSAAALSALRQVGYEWQSARGAAHWCYNGQTLQAIREQIETRL